MGTVRAGLGYRLVWSAVAVAMAAASLHQGTVGSSGWGGFITAAAWGLLAISWFLHPLVPAASVSKIIKESSKLVIGSATLRSCVTYTGFALLVLGLVIRFASGA